MKARKFLCLFVMALAVFALSGCGGGHDDPIDTTTQSQDVTPTPNTPVVSPDVDQNSGNDTGNDTSNDTSNDTGNDTGNNTGGETVTGDTYSSSTALENALLINGGTATYTNITVTKTGDATGSSDGSSGFDWTGTNAAILAKNGANVTINGATISSNAKGGNAVFSYGGNNSNNSNNSGDGTSITISDATITTTGDNSGGIMTTGGGSMTASNLTITTSGKSSAAIRSDSGGGTVNVTGGTYTTSGQGSPAIYSTAAITVVGADLKSTTAQGIVIEGGNSVTLETVNVDVNHTTLNGNDSYHQAVHIYQSMSGDASNGASFFKMVGGSITNAQGDIFNVTNTTTTITLSDSVAITNNDASGYFLRAAAGKWGSSNSNGGKVTLNLDGQTINGEILVDSISSLTLNMSNSSAFNGAINTTAQTGTVNVVMDSSSTWTLTDNTYVSSLTNNGGTINKGNYTLYVNGQAQ